MNIIPEILYLTWNRLEYTKKTLPLVFENTKFPFRLSIWDNGSTDGTVEYLKEWEGHPQIKQIVYKDQNYGLSPVTNEFWQRLDANTEIVGKIDNDTILYEDWLEKVMPYMLVNADNDRHLIGVISLNHWHIDDLKKMENNQWAWRKYIRTIASDQQFLHMKNIGGTAYLTRRDRIEGANIKTITTLKSGWTEVQWNLTRKGYRHGYVMPLSENIIKHLDDFRYEESMCPLAPGRRQETAKIEKSIFHEMISTACRMHKIGKWYDLDGDYNITIRDEFKATYNRQCNGV